MSEVTGSQTRSLLWDLTKTLSQASGPPLVSPSLLETDLPCNVCLVAQLCAALCNPMDRSPPGSSVHGDSPGKNTRVKLSCPPPGDLPNSGIEPRSPALQMDSLPSGPPGKPLPCNAFPLISAFRLTWFFSLCSCLCPNFSFL